MLQGSRSQLAGQPSHGPEESRPSHSPSQQTPLASSSAQAFQNLEPATQPLQAESSLAHQSSAEMDEVHDSNLEDIMSAVARLEEQGRLVEASKLMARGLGNSTRP